MGWCCLACCCGGACCCGLACCCGGACCCGLACCCGGGAWCCGLACCCGYGPAAGEMPRLLRRRRLVLRLRLLLRRRRLVLRLCLLLRRRRLVLRLCLLLRRLLLLGLRRFGRLLLGLFLRLLVLLRRRLGVLLLRLFLFLLPLLRRRLLRIDRHVRSDERHRTDDSRRDEHPVQHAHNPPTLETEVSSCPDNVRSRCVSVRTRAANPAIPHATGRYGACLCSCGHCRSGTGSCSIRDSGSATVLRHWINREPDTRRTPGPHAISCGRRCDDTATGALPAWPPSRQWGYYPSSGLGLIVLVLVVLMLAGRL